MVRGVEEGLSDYFDPLVCEICRKRILIDLDISLTYGNMQNLPYKHNHKSCYDNAVIREFLEKKLSEITTCGCVGNEWKCSSCRDKLRLEILLEELEDGD